MSKLSYAIWAVALFLLYRRFGMYLRFKYTTCLSDEGYMLNRIGAHGQYSSVQEILEKCPSDKKCAAIIRHGATDYYWVIYFDSVDSSAPAIGQCGLNKADLFWPAGCSNEHGIASCPVRAWAVYQRRW